MNLAQGLERRLEKFADSASASVFRGKMHPISIATRIVRQLEFLAVETTAGPQVPNNLLVGMNQADLNPELDRGALIAELEHTITQTALERGWRLIGRVQIHIRSDGATPRGLLECTGTFQATPLEPWGQLIADDGTAVLPIVFTRTVLGRDLDCDVRVANQEVSRHHALIYREGARSFIRDLGSSNGTFVNGLRAADKALTIVAGDNVLVGDLSFTYRMIN